MKSLRAIFPNRISEVVQIVDRCVGAGLTTAGVNETGRILHLFHQLLGISFNRLLGTGGHFLMLEVDSAFDDEMLADLGARLVKREIAQRGRGESFHHVDAAAANAVPNVPVVPARMDRKEPSMAVNPLGYLLVVIV